MRYPEQIIYEGAAINAPGDIITINSPRIGAISAIHFKVSKTDITGNAIFKLVINGTNYTGTTFTLLEGETEYSIDFVESELAVPSVAAVFDEVKLVAVTVPAGGIGTYINFQIDIESPIVLGGDCFTDAFGNTVVNQIQNRGIEEIPAPPDGSTLVFREEFNTFFYEVPGGGETSLPSGDLNAGTNKLEKLQNVPIEVTTQILLADDFTADEINEDRWAVGDSANVSTAGNKVTMTNAFAARLTTPPTGYLNFTGKFLVMEVDTANNGWIYLSDSGGKVVSVRYQPTVNLIRLTVNNGTGDSHADFSPFPDAADRHFIRLRESAGAFYLAISADGETWGSEITNGGSSINKAAVSVAIFGTGATWFIDNVNSDIVLVDGISDKSVILYDQPTGTFRNFTLLDLKTALDALP